MANSIMYYLKLILIVYLQSVHSWEVDDVEYDKMPALFTLDDYHHCLLYNGTYCYMKVELFADPPNQLMDIIHNYTYQRVRNYNHTYLEKGVCVTNKCRKYFDNGIPKSSDDLHEILNTCVNETIWNEFGLQARVTNELCQTKEESKIINTDIYDWWIAAIVMSIVAFNILGTYYDHVLDEKNRHNLSKGIKAILCFSISRNWRYLMKTSSTNEKIQVLKGINSIRIASSISVIVAHAALITFSNFLANPQDYEKNFKSLLWIPLFNGSFVVHVFFVIASFLHIYNFEMASEIKRLTWKDLPLIVIHRFFRQIPPLFLVIAFSATWMRHVGSGPLWGRNVLMVADQCRTYWWTHVLYINNYIHENKFCNIHTWHLAVDSQLFILTTIMYFTVQGKKRLRNFVLLILLVIGIIMPALHVMWYNLDAAFLFNPEFSRGLGDDNFRYLNVLTHNNITPYVFGMYTGYMVSKWQKKGVTFEKNKMFVFFLNCIGPLVTCLMYGICYMYDRDTPLAVRMVYQALMRVFMGGIVSAIIVSIAMKVDNFRGILEWNGWVICGKLSYSVYLSHMIFVHILAGLQTHLITLNYLTFFVRNIGFLVFSYLIAIPFYLMVEAPLNPILKVLLSKSEKQGVEGNFLYEIRNEEKEQEEKKSELIREPCEDAFQECENQKIKSS